MAATKRNAMNIAEARSKIRTTQLLNRLQNHAVGKIEMSQTQVRATEILLRKVIPDLSQTEQTNFDGDRERTITDKPMTAEDWEARYGDGLTNGNGSAVH